MPPRGHYLAHEAGRLAGVSGQTIGQWARRGYIRSSQSMGQPRVYSYQDAAEAMVVHALLEGHVSHRAIKAAIRSLRAEHGHDWPLSHADLSIPADHPRHASGKKKRRVIVRLADSAVDTTTGHPVLPEVDLVEIAADLRRGGWAARTIEDLQHIEVNPNRLSGRPVIAGHRIPAEDVARLAAHRHGRRTLRADYDLDDEQIDDAVKWWAAVRGFENDLAA